MISKLDRDLVLNAWNQTELEIPDAPFHEHVRAAAKRLGSKRAVIYGSDGLTYAELDQRASQLARHLCAAGLSGCRVGVHLARTPEMFVALLGIAMAGGCYVPLDPTIPAERLLQIQEDARLVAVVTASDIPACPWSESLPIVELDRACLSESEPNSAWISPDVGPGSLAYVLFTSGSTGRPKGVEITHGALANFLAAFAQSVGLVEEDRFLALTTIAFDIAVVEMLLPLTLGASTVLASAQDARDPTRLMGLIHLNRVSVLQATPVTWRMLREIGSPIGLRIALCGGEALDTRLREYLCSVASAAFNVYGPTETTVWSTSARLTATGPITVGRPLGNTTLFILDAEEQPIPIGEKGELYIGGAGVARGYSGRPELTAERFKKIRLRGREERVYRTGDIARYLPSGEVEVIGRTDNQIKLRGYRIELGDVEHAIAEATGVIGAAVVVTGHEQLKRLIAYVSLRHDSAIEGVKSEVASRLPAYMLPSAYVAVEKLPTTISGKVDRTALAQLEPPIVAAEDLDPDLESELCARIAAIWQRLLKVPKVYANSSFTELGGDSLACVSLSLELESALGIPVPVDLVINQPVLRDLAHALSRALASGVDPVFDLPQNFHLLRGPATGAKSVLFLVHSFSGFSAVYHGLIQAMKDREGTIVGIEPPKTLPIVPQGNDVIRTLAKLYAAQIAGRLDGRRATVAGWCSGGAISVEIGKCLREDHGIVARVIALSPDVEHPVLSKSLSEQERSEEVWHAYIAAITGPGKARELLSDPAFLALSIADRVGCVFRSRNAALGTRVQYELPAAASVWHFDYVKWLVSEGITYHADRFDPSAMVIRTTDARYESLVSLATECLTIPFSNDGLMMNREALARIGHIVSQEAFAPQLGPTEDHS